MPPKDDPAATSVRFCSKKKRDGPKKGSGSVRPGPSPCIGYTELPSKTPKEPVTHGLASSLLRARFCRVVDKFFFPEKLSFFYTSILPFKKKTIIFPITAISWVEFYPRHSRASKYASRSRKRQARAPRLFVPTRAWMLSGANKKWPSKRYRSSRIV
jgi:hypothetical protein